MTADATKSLVNKILEKCGRQNEDIIFVLWHE